jgi:TPR repeat protein
VPVIDSEAGIDDLERGLDLLLSGGSVEEATKAFQSAARKGLAEGYLQLARLERENGNEGAACDHIRHVEGLAERGDAFANLSMAIFHMFGEGNGSSEEEEQKSVRSMRRAAELGNPVAQLNLAQRLFRGLEGEAEDRDAYEIWIGRAIEQGLLEAVIVYSRNRLELKQDFEPWLLSNLKVLASESEEARELLEKATGDRAASTEF